ncbi:SDR family NAD(P)-dependent oxidoreductase [Nonomuraea sp. NPDC049158]|uniref:SDR family NAD(P)-dependent oxidoreductase n=1 Tax=Nonomuraea sp. NPDC049158 TaxID=3155649 RepID=UPI0033C38642
MTNRYRALFDLTGKSALVMGAASGIGQATAQMLAGLGAHTTAASRRSVRRRQPLSAKCKTRRPPSYGALQTAAPDFGR